MLTAVRDNAARIYMHPDSNPDDRREYGDAGMLVETIRSALMGDDQDIVVAEAGQYSEDEQNDPAVVKAFKAQQKLREWADRQRFPTKLVETERNAVSLGDGVYTLGIDWQKETVVVSSWDPGFYFPYVMSMRNGFPTRVHIAWELTKDEVKDRGYPDNRLVIHRITWELREVEPYNVPWEEKPVTRACFLTEAEWVCDELVRTVNDLTSATAHYVVNAEGKEIRDLNIGFDNIPVIHIPNTVAEGDLYGRSSLMAVMQLLDDIEATDTDLQAASAVTGTPPIWMSGQGAQPGTDIKRGPNQVFMLGADGKAGVLSGADDIEPLMRYRDSLIDRTLTNARIPAAQVGRLKPSEVPSGITLQLSFSPMKTLIEEMRLVRRDKYRLMLKFVQRMMMMLGQLDDVFDAELVFGAYMPLDRAGTITDVVNMLNAKVISRPTAMKMLQSAGVPIDDISAELSEVDKRDYVGATQLLDATGDEKAVGDMLGIELNSKELPVQIEIAQDDTQ